MKQTLRSALGHAAAFLLLLITEILIGMYGLGWIRSYGGDVLVLPLLYCLIRIFTRALPHTLPLCLFGVGCFAELLQLMKISELLGFKAGSLPAILIGTRADWMDVICYGLGTVLIYIVILLSKKYSSIPKKFRPVLAVICAVGTTVGLIICWVQMVLTYRFDYDPEWMMGKSLTAVQERYVRYDAKERSDEHLEEQGYVFIAQECYFHDFISSAGNFYYLYYVKCNENDIVIDVQVVDTGISG